MKERRCENCEWWTNYNNLGVMECRRFPPNTRGKTGDIEFPILAADDWCGEFKEDQNEILLRSIATLGMCVRAYRGLRKNGITTIGQLVEKKSWELLSIKNFGITALENVKECLKKIGLSLAHL